MEDDHLRGFNTAEEEEAACKRRYLDEIDGRYISSVEEEYIQHRSNNNIVDQQNLPEVDGSNWLEEETTKPPIGLKLRKTPSLLNFIEMSLSSESEEYIVDKDMAERLKAVNIPVLLLKIGSWQLVSRYEGDLVSKCYFAKRKLIWEILDGSLKRKLEMSWSDVIGLNVIMPDGTDNGCDILDVELIQPPSFALELNPQPRKHTQWKDTDDFTESQALIYRRHHLEFPPGNLAKLYNKLLQNDERLLKLSKNSFPTFESPYFNTRNEFDQSQFFASFQGHPTSIIPPPPSLQIPAPLNSIPDYFHQGSPFSFTHPNMLTSSDFSEIREEFAVEEDGVNIVTLHQFDNNGKNILFGDVPNYDLPPLLPENNTQMEPYNSFLPGQEATLLASGNSDFPLLDHQGIVDTDEQFMAMLNEEATLQDVFDLLPQYDMPTTNNESYFSGFDNQ